MKYDGVDLGYTKGGVKFKDEVMKTEITYDQTGETVQNTVTKGRKASVDVPLTNQALALIEDLIAGATVDADGMIVATTTGKDGRTGAKELILTIMDGASPSTDADKTLVIFKADPTSKIDWGFDNAGQRITLVTFNALPDDASGNIGNMWRVGNPA
ncbi:MAG: hypothetical protein WC329_05135 [Candidatus Omnitrophota bacterium]